MSRKSQVDKWNAKWSKKQIDENVIAEQKAKEERETKTPLLQAKTEGITKGEIRIHTERDESPGEVVFAADYDALNSGTLQKVLSGLSREGVRDTLKEIEDVSYNANMRFFNSQLEMIYKVQEQASYDGTLRALKDFNHAQELGQLRAFNELFNNQQVKTQQEERQNKNTQDNFDYNITANEVIAVKDKIRYDNYLDELKELVIEAHNRGLDPTNGKLFKKQGSRHSGLYQRYMRDNKGVKGAWKSHIQEVLKINN